LGAAVGGYVLVDFFKPSEAQRLAQTSGINFERLWRVAREQRPASKQRLLLNGELLQILGDGLLRENSHTRQYGAALSRTEAELRALTAQIITSQEDERRRVARELHDNICQKLAVLEIDTHQMEPKIVRDPDSATQDLQQLRNGIGSLSEEVRRISHALHSSVIDDLGLVAALRSLLEDFHQREDVIVTFIPQDVPERILPQTATGLYRIAQEALRNVAKHAAKAHVKVILSGWAGGVRLEIIDVGPGFDVRAPRSGLGLISMEERARIMHGSCRVESEIGKGTMVSVDVPLGANVAEG
jgi:two-component system CheB/CheR fusion protein